MDVTLWLADNPDGPPLSEVASVRLQPTPKMRHWKNTAWVGLHAMGAAKYFVMGCPHHEDGRVGLMYGKINIPVTAGDIVAFKKGKLRVEPDAL